MSRFLARGGLGRVLRRSVGVAVRAAVLVMVPVVFVSSTIEPAAAEVYTTPEVGALIEIDGPAYGFGDVTCEGIVSVVYVLPTATEPGSAAPAFDDWLCSGGSDRSPNGCQPAEQGCPYVAWLKGTQCGGQLAGDLGPSDYDGFTHVAGTFSGSYYAGDQRCDPAEVCVRLEGSGSWRQACAPVLLDPPSYEVEEPTECALGSFERPSFAAARLVTGTYRQQLSLGTFWASVTGLPNQGSWVGYVVVQSTDGITTNWNTVNGGGAPAMSQQYNTSALVTPLQIGYSQWVPATTGALDTTTRETAMSKRNTWASGNDPAVGGAIIGYGVIGDRTPTLDWANVPQSNASGRYGVTNPAECSFYWGTKIASTPTDDYDEPVGPLTVGVEPPTGPPGEVQPVDCDPELDPGSPGSCSPSAEEEGCDFSILDPGTWLEGGMCIVASGFGGLLEAIESLIDALAGLVAGFVDLAADIVDGILGGLAALFVPSPGFFSGAFDDLTLDLQRAEVTAWTDAFGEAFDGETTAGSMPITYSGGGAALLEGSACQGPGIHWDKFDDMGLDGDIYPMSSCSGTMAQVAAATKLILTGLIGIASLIKCLGIVAAALGFTKDTPSLQPDARGV